MKPSVVSEFFLLKGDSRYTVFDHVPEQRERWLRVRTSQFQFHGDKITELTMKNYLSNLSASKLSVHVDG